MGTSLVSKSLPIANSNSVKRLFSARKKKYYDSQGGMLQGWLAPFAPQSYAVYHSPFGYLSSAV